MNLILDNVPQSLMILGILALIIEIAVLGFSTFVLLFLGISRVSFEKSRQRQISSSCE